MEIQSGFTLREGLLDRIRTFNRKYFNPFSLSFAGRPNSFWSVLLHVGRCSGEEYVTPVAAVRQNGGFVIPLTYGPRADWFKNAMAAGSCKVIYQGQVFNVTQPEMLSAEEGLTAFYGIIRSLLEWNGIEFYLRFNQCTEAEDSAVQYQSFTENYPLSRGLWVIAAAGFLLIGIRRIFKRRG